MAIGREPDNEFYAKRKTSEGRAREKEGGREGGYRARAR